MNTYSTTPPSYWYGESEDDERGTRVMQAMREYRAAEMAMRRRTQDSMAMGENELLILRFLTLAAAQRHEATPIDLARHLGLSTASITALLDRLERSGHVTRQPHASDRRKVVVCTTVHADDEMRDTLTGMHARMMRATHGMTESEATVVTAFLRRMRCAVDDVCDPGQRTCCSVATRRTPAMTERETGGAAA